ncbi:MAG: AAA family ATPase, partial [Micropruina sp.]
MDPASNPYAPGAGVQPVALIGRDEQLTRWATQLARAERRRPARSEVLYGLRGVGKTVLLRRLHKQVELREWVAGFIEAGTGKALRELVVEAFQLPLAELARPSAGKRIRKALRTFLSFKASLDSSGTWTFGIDLDADEGGGANTGALDLDLLKLIVDLSSAMEEEGRGVALLIDEAQDLRRDEMTTLCAIVHAANQRSLPFVVALAGLPSLPGVLAEAKSYSERLFQFSRIEHLPRSDAAAVLAEPASLEGVSWDRDALDHA